MQARLGFAVLVALAFAVGQLGVVPLAYSAEAPAKSVPTDLPGVWRELTSLRDAIGATIDKGELGAVHEKAERLGPLAQALAAQASSLPTEKRTRVEGAAKQMPRVADALHDAADEGDATRTKKQFSALTSLIKLMEAQFPPEQLKK